MKNSREQLEKEVKEQLQALVTEMSQLKPGQEIAFDETIVMNLNLILADVDAHMERAVGPKEIDADDAYSQAYARNQLRAEIRQRAGLEVK